MAPKQQKFEFETQTCTTKSLSLSCGMEQEAGTHNQNHLNAAKQVHKFRVIKQVCLFVCVCVCMSV